MHETAYLNPELTIIYEDRRGEETEHIVYHEPEGIKGFCEGSQQEHGSSA